MAKEFGLTDEQVELEKKGKALMKAGIDMEALKSIAELGDYDE